MSEDMQEPRRVLEDLVRRPVANVEDAEVVAEASRLLRDLLRGRGPKLARRIGDEPDLVFREEPRWRSS